MEVLIELYQNYVAELILIRNEAHPHPASLIAENLIGKQWFILCQVNATYLHLRVGDNIFEKKLNKIFEKIL